MANEYELVSSAITQNEEKKKSDPKKVRKVISLAKKILRTFKKK